MQETKKHLEAFKLYMDMGGMSPEFLSAFVKKFEKCAKTGYRWQKQFNWKERAKKPIQEAVQNLEADMTLKAEELIGSLLDLCHSRMEGLETQLGYIKSIFGTAFDMIESGDLKVESISDLNQLVLSGSRLARDEQAYMRILLALVGKPEMVIEEQMIVQFRGLDEGLFDDYSSDGDAEDISEGD